MNIKTAVAGMGVPATAILEDEALFYHRNIAVSRKLSLPFKQALFEGPYSLPIATCKENTAQNHSDCGAVGKV